MKIEISNWQAKRYYYLQHVQKFLEIWRQMVNDNVLLVDPMFQSEQTKYELLVNMHLHFLIIKAYQALIDIIHYKF